MLEKTGNMSRTTVVPKTGERVKCPLLVCVSTGAIYDGPSPAPGTPFSSDHPLVVWLTLNQATSN